MKHAIGFFIVLSACGNQDFYDDTTESPSTEVDTLGKRNRLSRNPLTGRPKANQGDGDAGDGHDAAMLGTGEAAAPEPQHAIVDIRDEKEEVKEPTDQKEETLKDDGGTPLPQLPSVKDIVISSDGLSSQKITMLKTYKDILMHLENERDKHKHSPHGGWRDVGIFDKTVEAFDEFLGAVKGKSDEELVMTKAVLDYCSLVVDSPTLTDDVFNIADPNVKKLREYILYETFYQNQLPETPNHEAYRGPWQKLDIAGVAGGGAFSIGWGVCSASAYCGSVSVGAATPVGTMFLLPIFREIATKSLKYLGGLYSDMYKRKSMQETEKMVEQIYIPGLIEILVLVVEREILMKQGLDMIAKRDRAEGILPTKKSN